MPSKYAKEEFFMNPILKQIISTRTCPSPDGTGDVDLLQNTAEPLEGELIRKSIDIVQAKTTLDIGLGYGTSSMFICDALTQAGTENICHIAIDPHQRDQTFRGIGLNNLKLAGYESIIRFIEQPSHEALPALVNEGIVLDFAFIDGYHTFDHTLIDFFYVDLMLREGGIVMLDDTDWPAIRKVCAFILQNRCYEVFDFIRIPTGTTPKRLWLNRQVSKIAKWKSLQSYFQPAWSFVGNYLDELTYGSCVAFRKVANDDRRWDHYVEF